MVIFVVVPDPVLIPLCNSTVGYYSVPQLFVIFNVQTVQQLFVFFNTKS
jgi:hypothetical protein